ncbi:hypothetical protein QVD17_31159 [Tagetes erecta]|uniref:Uncharacterized protein n=1 Tax=Tagetes erecta TaxID=13708 RepID=A0AAD8K3U4_TARER|nr:hypothetical protein QVD17_31159 [Tagetes erecta]
MASLLRLITCNLVASSIRRPTIVYASHFLTIHAAHRSYTTMPKDDFYDQSCPRIIWPKISSISFHMWMDPEEHDWYLDLYIPRNDPHGSTTKEELHIQQKIHGLDMKDLIASTVHEHKGKMHKESINLTHKSSNNVNEEMKDGTLKTNIMTNILANDIIDSFRDISAKRRWAYYGSCFSP